VAGSQVLESVRDEMKLLGTFEGDGASMDSREDVVVYARLVLSVLSERGKILAGAVREMEAVVTSLSPGGGGTDEEERRT
jgi:hypothetical protein